MPYLFVAASVIAVLGILFIIKGNMEKIKEDPESLAKAQLNIILGASIVEIIPILLVVLGFVKMDQVNFVNDSVTITPLVIVMLLMAFSIIFILLQVTVGVPKQIKSQVLVLGLIGLFLSFAIPIVSLVALFIMMV